MKVSADIAAKMLRNMAERIPAELVRAERDNLRFAQKLAMLQSSGTLSTQTLRDLGHPYSKRNPMASLDPALINKQSGVFRSSWRMLGPEQTFDIIRSRLQNIASYSGFMRGTKWMIPRPIEQAVIDQLAGPRARRIRLAIAIALMPRK